MADILGCLAEQALIAAIAAAAEAAAESATSKSQADEAMTPGEEGGAGEASISTYGALFFGAAARCLIVDARNELEEWMKEQADIHLAKAEEYYAIWLEACNCARDISGYADTSYTTESCVQDEIAIAFASAKRKATRQFRTAQRARSRYQTGLVSRQGREAAKYGVSLATQLASVALAADCVVQQARRRENAARCALFLQGAVAPSLRNGFSYAQDYAQTADRILAAFENGSQALFAYGLDKLRESREEQRKFEQSFVDEIARSRPLNQDNYRNQSIIDTDFDPNVRVA